MLGFSPLAAGPLAAIGLTLLSAGAPIEAPDFAQGSGFVATGNVGVGACIESQDLATGILQASSFIVGNIHVLHILDTPITPASCRPQFVFKRTTETLLLDLDCSALLGTGEAILSCSLSEPSGTLVFGPVSINPLPVTYPGGITAPTGQVVQFTIAAGVIPTGANRINIPVTPQITTSFGEILDADFIVRLQDTPDSYCC